MGVAEEMQCAWHIAASASSEAWLAHTSPPGPKYLGFHRVKSSAIIVGYETNREAILGSGGALPPSCQLQRGGGGRDTSTSRGRSDKWQTSGDTKSDFRAPLPSASLHSGEWIFAWLLQQHLLQEGQQSAFAAAQGPR